MNKRQTTCGFCTTQAQWCPCASVDSLETRSDSENPRCNAPTGTAVTLKEAIEVRTTVVSKTGGCYMVTLGGQSIIAVVIVNPEVQGLRMVVRGLCDDLARVSQNTPLVCPTAVVVWTWTSRHSTLTDRVSSGSVLEKRKWGSLKSESSRECVSKQCGAAQARD